VLPVKVSDLFVKSLENEGVKYIFGVPGEENEDLLFSLEDSPIQFVPTRHEQGAAFIANVWGRLAGKAGVCLATLGPGATNLITGVADANLDKAPMVAITAQGGLTRMHHESHQYLDIVNTFRPITKWNTAISAPDIVTEVVRKAFKLAESEKPGATQIELSEDLAKLQAETKLEPIPPKRVRRPSPDYKAVERTVEILTKATRPLIIAGNGAIRKLASSHLKQLAKKYNIPVACTFMGKGAVSDRMEQSLLSIGLGFKDFVMEAVEAADLIISVGSDIAEVPPEKWNPKGEKKIIHVDFTPAEVYTHYNPELEVVGDISGVLWALDQRLEDEHHEFDVEWYRPIRSRILDDIGSYELKEGNPFTVPGTLNVIREILDDHGLLISDVGSHKMWIARNFPTYCANGCIISNGLASMGISLPGGIAASLIDPERQVVAAMGDGGFLMNSQELETAKRLGVGFTILVFNDNDYGLISWKQRMSKGRSVCTKIGNPDFKAYAESFGIKGYRPESVSELKEQLGSCITGKELCVVEVPVDPAVNNELVEKLSKYWEEKS
jgi:acetolactate synthase-1/2/3 large subunit